MDEFGDALDTTTGRNHALLPVHKLCAALRFFSGGNIYAELARVDFAEMTAYALAQIGLMLKRQWSIRYEILPKIIQEHQVLGGSLEQNDTSRLHMNLTR